LSLILLANGLAMAQSGSDPSLKLEPLKLEPEPDEEFLVPEPDPQWLEGRGENEVVLVHGLGGSAEVWNSVLPYLTNGFTVKVYELHGHGATKPMKNPSIAAESVALGQWIKDQELVYPSLVGHGLGGMIAMQYTFDHPSEVNRLIIVDSGPRQLASPEYKAEVGERLMNDYDRFVASHFVGISKREEISEKAVDWALRTDAVTFTSLLLSSFDWDLTSRLAYQSVPMLVVGSASFLPEPGKERAQLTQYGFSDARVLSFKRVQGSGHYVMLENPTYMASIIQVFLKADQYR